MALDLHGCSPSGQHRTNIWIWSASLTRSHPPLSVGAEYELQCSYNGFLLVQRATTPILQRLAARATTRDVCVVDAVYTDTGDLVTYPHCLSMWRRIARRLRKIADLSGPQYGHPLWTGYPWSAAALAEAHAVLDQHAKPRRADLVH